MYFIFNSSFQIDEIVSKLLGSVWLGVYPLDKLPYLPENKAIIVNTHTSNLKGEHWIAVYHKHDKVYVFDSFGFYYPSMLVTHLSRIPKPIVYNRIRYQHWLTKTCGEHCILWLLKMYYS